ncbi:MAG: TonB-dependent receptor [Sphingomonas sp.]|uniref:TonB-dependent receptor n=1 Tax=Sphingomonas sp. TaxID=28214 RepID=UPI001AD5F2DA|nr:TonB-dependent receptor [Sphingomonas sp.]MBN8815241.1 TonB-dependent receptor [Sphingomonas sp.]
MIRTTALLFGAAPLALTIGAMPAVAQTAPAEPTASDDQIQDIIITARRTEERSQKVPVSVTALSQEDLRSKAIGNATDLQNFTPSLSVLGHVSRNQEQFTLRGMGGSGGAGTGSGPGVVAYFAEVPNTASGPGVFYDLQSLQVLKGPQGTLFGRNSTGGAVLIEPKRPDFDGFSGYFEQTLGSFNRMSGNGAANFTLIGDVLAVRVAGQFDFRDGYVKDIVTKRDYLNRDNWSGRIGIQFNPSANFTSYTAISYRAVDENGGGTVLLAVNPAKTYGALLTPLLAAQQARGNRNISLSTPTKDIARSFLILNNSELKLSDTFSIKNIFSYGTSQSNTASDSDASSLAISDLYGAFEGGWNNNLRTITEELQLRYNGPRLSLQVGGFYLKDRTPNDSLTFRTINPMQAPFGIAATPIILPVAPYIYPVLSVQDRAEVHGTSKALYANANFKITPRLSLTAGYRWTWDTYGGHISSYLPASSFANLVANVPAALLPTALTTQALGSNLCVYDAFIATTKGQLPTLKYPNCTYPGFDGKSGGPTWQGGLDWQADDNTLLYAVSRRGYKSGGINPVILILSPSGANDPLFPFKPEKVTDAEVGLKRDWALGGGVSLRTNVAAFYTWYNDIQVVQRQVYLGSDAATNAQKAHVFGVEFEGQLRLSRALQLGVTYSYNDAKYDVWNTLPTSTQPSQDFSNTPFLYVPKHKYSVDARYTLPLPESVGRIALQATWSWQSSQRVAPDSQPYDTIPAYGLLNLRAEWNNIGKQPIDLAVFGTNVTNRNYLVTANPSYYGSGWTGAIYGEPAQYGVSVRYHF